MISADALRIVAKLSSLDAYPWPEERVETWIEFLTPYDATAMGLAVIANIRAGKFPKTPADLMEAYVAAFKGVTESQALPGRYPSDENGRCIRCAGAGWLEDDKHATRCPACHGAHREPSHRPAEYEPGERERILAMIRSTRTVLAGKPARLDLEDIGLTSLGDEIKRLL